MEKLHYNIIEKLLFLLLILVVFLSENAYGDSFDVIDSTIHAVKNLNVSAAAMHLRHAMATYGTNETEIIYTLIPPDLNQRRLIEKKYKKFYKRNLTQDLKDELSGSFESLILALLEDSDTWMARDLHLAMKGLGTDEDTLTEILCCHDTSDLTKIADIYKQAYKKTLEEVVHAETSGSYRDLLHILLTKPRSAETPNVEMTKKIAQSFVRAGFGKTGKMNDAILIEQLTTHSFAQLKEAMKQFSEIVGTELRDSVKRAFSGDFGKALLRIVDCAENRPRAYAMRLKEAIGKFSNDDNTLIRIIVFRSQIDLNRIRAEYQKLFNETLNNRIRQSTNADFRAGLLAIVLASEPNHFLA